MQPSADFALCILVDETVTWWDDDKDLNDDFRNVAEEKDENDGMFGQFIVQYDVDLSSTDGNEIQENGGDHRFEL